MRLSHGIAVALTFAATSLTAQSSPSSEIFRYINIQPFGRIELGKPFAQVSVLGAPISPGLYQLVGAGGRPTQWADTKAILVELSETNLVTALYFLYLPSLRTFPQREAGYVESLGVPERFTYDSAWARIIRSRWQDAQTEFELIEMTKSDTANTTSVLRDRRLAAAVQPES
jgi:hypothetical protein